VGLDFGSVMGADAEHAAVPIVQVGLEHLNPAARDEGSAHTAQQFLGLAAEHHARDDFDPSVLRTMVHGAPTSR